MQASLASKPENKPQIAKPTPEPSPEATPQREEAGASAGLPLFLRGLAQAKLTVGAPDDPLEREADQVAERAVRDVPATAPTYVSAVGRPVSTNSAAQRSTDRKVSEVAPLTANTSRSQGGFGLTSAANSVFRSAETQHGGPDMWAREAGVNENTLPSALTASGGSPLPAGTRQRVEPTLGVDLGQVRVHSDTADREAARVLQARAFTHRNHIWLGPGQSASDIRLMAHEAAHVLQQGAVATANPAALSPLPKGANGAIQRDPDPAPSVPPPTPAPASGVTPPSAPPPSSGPTPLPAVSPEAVRAAAEEVVELKGTPYFQPSAALAEMIDYWSPGLLSVRVRFGDMGEGRLDIRRNKSMPSLHGTANTSGPVSGGFETDVSMGHIPLRHKALPSTSSPQMFLNVQNSVVTGFVGFLSPAAQPLRTLEQALGWRGLAEVTPVGRILNQVRDGKLDFGFTQFRFRLEDEFEGTGSWFVENETEDFAAEALVHADGIADEKIPLKRAGALGIFGTKNLSLSLSPTDAFGGTISGSLQATLANGVMTVMGTGRYRSRRLNGSFTVLLAPRRVAWEHVIRQLPGGGAPNITAGAALAPGYAVVGWGTLDFRVNEWLTGSASVVIDPDGYITSHGVIRPTRTFEFLTDPEKYGVKKKIGEIPEKSMVIAPVWATTAITGSLSAELWAAARVGPGRVYDLEVQGQFSTRPGSVFEAAITGRVNLSAYASLQGEIRGGLHYTLVGKYARAVSLTVTIGAKATVRAYVELQPTFAREAGPNPDQPQYRITAALTAAGAADLALTGDLDFSILGFGPHIRVGNYEYHLGQVGMKATVSHVLGSKEPISVDLEAADFETGRFQGFVDNLIGQSAEKDTGDHESELGQTGAVPTPRPATPTHLTRTFYMSGEPHTLWLEQTPGPVLKMASGGDDALTDKLRSEIVIVEQQRQAQQGPEAEAMGAQVSELRSIERQAVTVEQSLARRESETRENSDVAGFGELGSELAAYGAQYQKTDLAQAAATPPSPAPGAVQVDSDGRYIITNQAELEAVRAARPTRPDDLDSSQETMWGEYLKYFDERIRLIERDLSRGRGTISHDAPQTWERYQEARATFDPMRQKKEFQNLLKNHLLQTGEAAATDRIDIDLGMQKGNRRARTYADVVVTDPQNNLTVYSAKVHNVMEQVRKQSSPVDVERWIDKNLRTDITEARDSYGGMQRIRKRQNPLFDQKVFVNRVILVWDSRVIPADYRSVVLERGIQIAATFPREIAVEVRVEP